MARGAAPDDAGSRHLQRRGRARAAGSRHRRRREPPVPQPDAVEARARRLHRRSRRALRPEHDRRGTRHHQVADVPLRNSRRDHDLEERHRRPGREGRDPLPLRGRGRERREGVRPRPDDRGGAPRAHRRHLDRGHERGRGQDDGHPVQGEPDLHDGQLGRPRIVQPDQAARRDARPDGKPEGRDPRASGEGELHGGPDGPRVLHLDPRCTQGARGHGSAHRRLRVPDPATRRRLAGRDRPRRRLRDRRLHRAQSHPRRLAEQERRGADRLGRRAQADQGRQARQDRDRRQERGDHDEPASPARRRVRGVRGGRHDPGSVSAEVPQRVRDLPALLRHVPRLRRDGRDRRRGRHHRRAVDRRAGHAADDAHLPHGWRGRIRHHARPATSRRDLRGPQPEGRRNARRRRRQGGHRRLRPDDQGHGHADGPRRGRRAPDLRGSTASPGGRGFASRRASSWSPERR